jgi:hypothetical protein
MNIQSRQILLLYYSRYVHSHPICNTVSLHPVREITNWDHLHTVANCNIIKMQVFLPISTKIINYIWKIWKQNEWINKLKMRTKFYTYMLSHNSLNSFCALMNKILGKFLPFFVSVWFNQWKTSHGGCWLGCWLPWKMCHFPLPPPHPIIICAFPHSIVE